MYHWLLAGAAPAVDGATCNVKVSWLAPPSSATYNWRMLTRGSGGVFCALSLSLPSAFVSSFVSTPGVAHGFGSAVPMIAFTSEQNGPSPTAFSAVNAVGEGPFCSDVKAIIGTALPNPCATPGVLTNDDTNADGSDNDSAQNTPPDPRVNIRQLYVAELGGANQLTFTLQVAPSTAGAAPASSQWYIVWQRQNPDADFDRYYVAMVTDSNGIPSFEYGKFGVPLDATNPNPNANTPVKLGDADSGNYNVETGVITIKVSNSKLENVHAGQGLQALNVRTYFVKPAAGPRSQNIASDITGDSSYTLVGNAACLANQAPIAQLLATPIEGNPPLTVNFNGSASADPDAGDSIASYTFSFGDGSPDVTQSSPTISHVYTHGGGFFATLPVKDSHGLHSATVASADIKVAAQLFNLSTRLQVQPGDNALIGGFIIKGSEPKKVVLRGLGPSLNVPGKLEDPVIQLYNSSNVNIGGNDDWKTDEQNVESTGLAPTNDRESALVITLNPGTYTVVMRGKNNGSGIGVVEVYDVNLAANSRLANISSRGFIGINDNRSEEHPS